MPDVDIDTALDWRGKTVIDRDGEKIGTFAELYLDESDRPAWAAVTTGLFGLRQSFVPLAEARPDGASLRVPFAKEEVKDAPNIDPAEQLSEQEEERLYRHYRLSPSRAEPDDADVGPADDQPRLEDEPPSSGDAQGLAHGDAQATEDRGTEDQAAAHVAQRPDDGGTAATELQGEGAAATEGPVQPPREAMTRSEEELVVGKRKRIRGRARLRKYVVTEHIQTTVPVQREEVRVEFEPATESADDSPRTEQAEEP
jgi:stress response protein YsnF